MKELRSDYNWCGNRSVCGTDYCPTVGERERERGQVQAGNRPADEGEGRKLLYYTYCLENTERDSKAFI